MLAGYINETLKAESTTEGYQVLDKLENLCRYRLNLGESGKSLLLDNFLYHFLGFVEPYQTVVLI